MLNGDEYNFCLSVIKLQYVEVQYFILANTYYRVFLLKRIILQRVYYVNQADNIHNKR